MGCPTGENAQHGQSLTFTASKSSVLCNTGEAKQQCYSSNIACLLS
jgi:hypothetical protein